MGKMPGGTTSTAKSRECGVSKRRKSRRLLFQMLGRVGWSQRANRLKRPFRTWTQLSRVVVGSYQWRLCHLAGFVAPLTTMHLTDRLVYLISHACRCIPCWKQGFYFQLSFVSVYRQVGCYSISYLNKTPEVSRLLSLHDLLHPHYIFIYTYYIHLQQKDIKDVCETSPKNPPITSVIPGYFTSTDSFAISPEDFVEAPTKKPIKRIPEAESNDIIVTEVGLVLRGNFVFQKVVVFIEKVADDVFKTLQNEWLMVVDLFV